MSSYLDQMLERRITVRQFLAKSAGWLARKSGLSDDDVDQAVKRADKATDEAAKAIAQTAAALLTKSFPVLPAATIAVIAERVANNAMDEIDTAIAAVGAFVKANN